LDARHCGVGLAFPGERQRAWKSLPLSERSEGGVRVRAALRAFVA
jgi:hypothetical protein